MFADRRLGLDREAWAAMATVSMRPNDDGPGGDPGHRAQVFRNRAAARFGTSPDTRLASYKP